MSEPLTDAEEKAIRDAISAFDAWRGSPYDVANGAKRLLYELDRLRGELGKMLALRDEALAHITKCQELIEPLRADRQAAVLAEREAIAASIDGLIESWNFGGTLADWIAAAIRARG